MLSGVFFCKKKWAEHIALPDISTILYGFLIEV